MDGDRDLLTRDGTWRTVLRALVFLEGLLLLAGSGTATAQSTPPGGFVEPATSTSVRSRVIPALPNRGAFTFPAPYNTTGIRVTNANDCGNTDCVVDVGYSYWRNMNNHVGSDTILIFLTLARDKGGGGPTLFSYNKLTEQVAVIGPLFDPSSPFSWATGEGWYWSATLPSILYLTSGPALYRYDVNTREIDLVADVTTYFGNDRYIWQTHTSNDDAIHSGTLRDSTTYDSLGCLTYNENTKQFGFYAKAGAYDECQVDKAGQWLVIKEQLDNANGEDNLIVNRVSGQQTRFFDQAGAPGHSDNGFGYMVGADNWYSLPGAIRVWTFGTPFPTSQPGTPPQGLLVYRTTDWAADIGHLSHANAAPGVASSQQYVCGGNAKREQLPRNNEVICFMLDGSLQVLVVAPVMTDLNTSGGGDDYHKQPKGNLDVTGQYFIWTSNVAGSRLDAFIVKVPTQLLTAQSSQPDLIVTALSSPPPAALPGSNFTVTDTVQNQGSGTASASTTRYLLSTDAQRDGGDISLTRSRAVPSLVGGTSYSGGMLTLTIPSSTPLGSYYLLACADDAGVVAESDETNNCRRSATTVQVTRPDLLMTAVSNPPASATPASGFSVMDTVKNQGGVTSGASTTRYYLSADQQKGPSARLLIGSRSVASLGAGASYSGSALTVTVPSSTPPGAYYLLACADDTAVVTESDEVNNCRASASSVVIGQTVRPDLMITALSNPPPTAAPGSSFAIADTLKNQSTAAAGSSTTRYYLSPDTQKDLGDTLLGGSRAVPSLAAGASYPGGALTLTIPATTPLGTYHLLACADDTAVVAESDEVNNCRASAGTMQVGLLGQADLFVTALANPPSTATPGSNR